MRTARLVSLEHLLLDENPINDIEEGALHGLHKCRELGLGRADSYPSPLPVYLLCSVRC